MWTFLGALVLTSVATASVVCPDGSQCPENSTCCKTAGGYECCPLPKAVCCSDGAHCCPDGYTCNVEAQTCDKKGLRIPIVSKLPLREKTELAHSSPKNELIVYCDSTHYCLDGNTCCKLATGGWGCCPYRKAVCCKDGNHCCPHFYKCDSSSTKCKFFIDISIPMFNKAPALVATKTLAVISGSKSSVVYCDHMYHCQDGYTCCRVPSGQWACCPLPQASCCRDGYHCCPHGYYCDVTSTRCLRSYDYSIPSLEKTPALVNTEVLAAISGSESSVVYCDNLYYCPDGNTCCRSSSGSWSCCPLPQASCCRDGYHCCPHGYYCDITLTCRLGPYDDYSIPSLEKTPALVNTEVLATISGSESSVVYCDNVYYCPDGNTCCRLPSGSWGCCPHPQASCCRDGKRCCPPGYYCDVTSTKCFKPSVDDSIPSLDSTPALV